MRRLSNSSSEANSGDNRSLSTKVISHGTALYLTAAIAPGIYDLTFPYALRLFNSIYGHGVEELVMIAHGLFVAVLTFIGLERSIAVLIALVTVAIGRYGWRFFGYAM